MYNNSYPVPAPPERPKPTIGNEKALDAAWRHLRVHGALLADLRAQLVYLPDNGGFRLAYKTLVATEAPFGCWEHEIDAMTGAVVAVRDTAIHENMPAQPATDFAAYEGPVWSRAETVQKWRETRHSGKQDPPARKNRVDGTARVFDPDPRTTLADGSLVDGSPPAAFTNAYVLRTLRDISETNGVYSLDGPWVTINDFEAPNTVPSTTTDGHWKEDRGNSAFNDAMTYFHIDQNQRYLQSLGYSGATGIQHGEPIRADADGRAADPDNSAYIPASNQLVFGHGGVDDNEDAGVILHEYGHAIIHDIVATWSGADTGAIGEGFGDYWSASYGYTTSNGSSFHPEWVFRWDAHDPNGPAGRSLDKINLIYDPSVTYGDHGTIQGVPDGTDQLWGTPLFQSFLTLVGMGYARADVDQIVIESFFGIGGNPTMRDMANATVKAASLLFPSGPHADVFHSKFLAQNIVAGGIGAKVIARTGQAGLTAVNNSVSVNNAGLVAFSGTTATGSGSFVANSTGGPRAVRTITASSNVRATVQLNDTGLLIARRGPFFFTQEPIYYDDPIWGRTLIEPGYSESSDYLQTWNADGTGPMNLVAKGLSHTDAQTGQTYKIGPFASVGWDVTLNNLGQAAFLADRGSGITSDWVLATPGAGGAFNTCPASGGAAPMIADEGSIVARPGSAGDSPILLFNYDLTPAGTVASPGFFTRLGRMPGISDDGRYVAFYGDLSGTGATALETNPGPGIFLSWQTSQGRVVKRVAGLTDQAGTALFGSLDGNQRVGVNPQSQDGKVLVVFAGTNSGGAKGVWAARFDPDHPLAVRMMTVILQGDQVDGTGPWDEFRLADPVNTNDQIAFWAKSGDQQAVLRTTHPVISVEQPAGSAVSNGDSRNFGPVPAGSTKTLTFAINNTGSDSLNLTGTPMVAVNGAYASEFTVVADPVSPLAPLGSTAFAVSFSPANPGPRAATLSIKCDDTSNTFYVIKLAGTAVPALHHFEISTVSSPQAVDTAFAVTIAAKDESGATLTSFDGTVDLTETGDGIGGMVSPATSQAFTAGLLSGQIVKLDKPGTEVSLTATRTGGTETGRSNSFKVLDHFNVWVSGATQAGFVDDPNHDGVANGLAWILGAANPLADGRSLLPEASSDSGKLRLHFRCLRAEQRDTAVLSIEHSNDLGQANPWSEPVAIPEAEGTTTVKGIDFTVTRSPGDYNDVIALVPSMGGRVFCRLRATK